MGNYVKNCKIVAKTDKKGHTSIECKGGTRDILCLLTAVETKIARTLKISLKDFHRILLKVQDVTEIKDVYSEEHTIEKL